MKFYSFVAPVFMWPRSKRYKGIRQFIQKR